MQYRIKNVAVLGSGIMGSGIACQLANVGIDVLMFDGLNNFAKRIASLANNDITRIVL